MTPKFGPDLDQLHADRQGPIAESDLRAMELLLQAMVEIDPQHPGFAFIDRVRRSILSCPAITP